MDTCTGIILFCAMAVSWCADVAAPEMAVAVRPPTIAVLVLALLVVVPVIKADGAATVTLSRPAVMVAAADPTVPGCTAAVAVIPVEVEVATEATVAALEVRAAGTVAVAAAEEAASAAAPVVAEDCNRDAVPDDADDGASVSSGGLGGGVAKPDQQVDGELLLDVTLLAQSKPTSTSTLVDHVVSHGDSDRAGDDETIGSSFR